MYGKRFGAVDRHIIRPLLVLCLLLVGTLPLAGAARAANEDRGTSRQQFLESLKILGSVYERVYYNYVEDIDAYDLLEAGINGMLDFLDEHSQYLPPVNYEDLMMSTEGEFGGLGISISTRDHYPTVVSPIEGTPAFLMGVQGGDKITEIDGESTLDFTSTDAVKLLRGEPGTEVTITIQRAGTDEPFPLTITRDIIKVDSVPYAFMINDIGYIRIQNFARSTADEMREKLAELRGQGARGLILDLRWNPGGLLEAANAVSEMFLEEGDLIVYTKGRLRQQNRSYFSERSHQDAGGLPTIVMVNGSSASASEIVTAALQDHDKGVVVGKTSFGKGSVQTVFPLSEDRALKLTTAKYYTPSGRSIHKDRHLDGADFDMTDTAVSEEAKDVETKREDKETFKTDAGRTIYGGGGVTPDIEIDQPYLSDFEVALERDGALFSFATEWAAKRDVPRDIRVNDEIRGEFAAFLKDREKIDEYLEFYELAMSDSLVEANQTYIDRGLRRELMRRSYGAEAAYRVAIEDDIQLLEVIKIFERARSLADLMAIADEWQGERLSQIDAEEKEAVPQ